MPTYTPRQPFDAASIIDSVASYIADEFDDGDWLADEIEHRIEARKTELDADVTAFWDAMIAKYGLAIELADEPEVP